ncbi:LysM peptidoglycan-binding domain-containing protein [Clostridium fallax]|uniref:LysM domain-containing protein n=1 Tax=Clostridium fallax TaxID=1533 RepID=A0A1M4V0D6_9CLOT|nr:LysM peptidoglycan-binding domain-containing protein [Clostridium fallax]SHE62363.1 LysM domain-containing protein [Clostridium fallax]SQB06611.1 lysM domain-containing protein [Clostridium fallax]
MGYKMYLGINNGEEGFIIPVLPEKIEISENSNNKIYNLINLGDINIINKPKLTEISFESYFPKHKGPYLSSEQLFEPSFYISKIREWREKKQKIRFIFVGGALEVNDLFTIENFKLNENGGEVGDIYYNLELKRYQKYVAKKVIIKTNNNSSNNSVVTKITNNNIRQSSPQTPKIHTVVEGDTLWHLAKKYLGNGNRWPEIYNINKDKIKNPNIIYNGQVLKIP